MDVSTKIWAYMPECPDVRILIYKGWVITNLCAPVDGKCVIVPDA
jgi:hypothetical protein